MVIHHIDSNTVDPVFYAVVPDSFMTRESINGSIRPHNSKFGDWADEIDSPILAPHDPWSF
jgi:hypothetical protein